MNHIEQYIFTEHNKNLNNEFDAFAKEIMNLQTAESFTLLYATDVHYMGRCASYVPVYYKLKEMVEFSGYIGADLLALGGDIVDGNIELENQYRDLYDIISLIRNSKTTSVAVSKGNHDDCSWYAFQKGLGSNGVINQEQWYTHVVNPIRVSYPMILDKNNISGGYYYIDYPLQKIRVININTNDVPPIDETKKSEGKYYGQWNFGVSEKQLKWLTNEALKFDEADWSVLVVSHIGIPIDDKVHNGDLVTQILSAFKNGTSGKAISNIEFFEAQVDYDFTDNKSNDFLCWLAGHNHTDTVTDVDGITVITARNLLGQIHDTPWDHSQITHLNTYYGSWDCMIIDKKSRKLVSKRYNQPQFDREINF